MIPLPARSSENPLGETARWVMKASLQRDYIVRYMGSESCKRRVAKTG
jgi:hypothetical protein